MTRNEKQLKSFTMYCKQNPEERFWQALRNWSGSPFILRADVLDFDTDEFSGTKDTFYEE